MGYLCENKKNTCSIVACGDSIMWGQGLGKESKFTSIVMQRISKLSGKRTSLLHLAHSGATINKESKGDELLWVNHTRDIPITYADGETPRKSPTILQQLELIPNPKNVDILLLDGGANDLSFSSYLFKPKNMIRIKNRKKIHGVAYTEVENLLHAARNKCPNAKIIYLGPYSPISKKSDFPPTLDSLLAVSVKGVEYVTDVVDTVTGAVTSIGNAITGGSSSSSPGFLTDETGDYKKEYPYGMAVFTNYCMQAISNFNDKYGMNNPVIFVHPGFREKDAAHASSNPLVAPWNKFKDRDVFDQRLGLVKQVFLKQKNAGNVKKLLIPTLDALNPISISKISWKSILDASDPNYPWVPDPTSLGAHLTVLRHTHFLHPNEKGAKQIADKIMESEPSLRRTTSVIPENTSLRKLINVNGISTSSFRTLSEHAISCYVQIEFDENTNLRGYNYLYGTRFKSGRTGWKYPNQISKNIFDFGYIDFPFKKKISFINELNGMEITIRPPYLPFSDNNNVQPIPSIASLTIFLNGKKFLIAKGEENEWEVNNRTKEKKFIVNFKKHKKLIVYK